MSVLLISYEIIKTAFVFNKGSLNLLGLLHKYAWEYSVIYTRFKCVSLNSVGYFNP